MTPERIARLREVLDRRQPDLSLATDFVHKPRNLSALIRNCDAAGVMRVHAVVGDRDFRAFRGTAMGSQRWVKVRRHSSMTAALSPLCSEGYQVLAAHFSDDAVDYRSVDYTKPTVLVMGAERRGVSAEVEALADACITIPMVGMVGSLNVAVASGIILAEAQLQRSRAGCYDKRRIDDVSFQRLFFEWGHPQLQQFCQQRGLRYPALNSEGEIDNPSAWYASVRAGTAARWEGHDE